MRIPDEAFVKELKEKDPSLDVGWNTIKERWQIVQLTKKLAHFGKLGEETILLALYKPSLLFTVEDENKNYQELDNRAINKINKILWDYEIRVAELMRMIEEEEAKQKERDDRRLDEDIHSITMDNLRQLKDGIEELRGK